MSRNSEAKKARRKKRLSGRGPVSAREPLFDDGPEGSEYDEEYDEEHDEEHDEIVAAVGEVSRWIGGRGWVLDVENSGDDLVTWVYPPSAAELGDDDLEPLTRVWLALEEDADAVTIVMGATLVGAGVGDEESGEDLRDGLYELDLASLAEDVAVLEAYRVGAPWPELD